LISGWAVDPRLREMDGFAKSTLAGKAPVTFGALCEALRNGDPFARKAMDHCISVWTSLLVSHCHTLDPSLLILSGGFMRSADLFVEDWMAATKARLWRPENMPAHVIAREPMLSAIRGAEVIAKRGLARSQSPAK
jgi:predicted NBD/HSP70 family sugar kinase